MRVKALGSLKSKLLKPCRKLLPIFTLNRKKPVYIRAPRLKTNKTTKKKQKSGLFRGLFRSRRKQVEGMDRLVQVKSFSERESVRTCDVMVFQSPSEVDDVEDSCRTFENYLAEMIVGEGKLRDLSDVEELLYCWNNLKCPVFIDLVSRFYGELCKDLFSAQAHPTSS